MHRALRCARTIRRRTKVLPHRARTSAAGPGRILHVHSPGFDRGASGTEWLGQTTALETLLGLVRPNSGSLHAFGHALPKGQRNVAGRMGALIEGPACNASLTGEHNLRLIGELHGAGPTEVAEALELVGIAHTARRAYSGYSLGMKQRLGVAGALISGPELLGLTSP
ncbi:ATP-binding cassette domain-containing protein [Streptomyces cyaneofuscatus]